MIRGPAIAWEKGIGHLGSWLHVIGCWYCPLSILHPVDRSDYFFLHDFLHSNYSFVEATNKKMLAILTFIDCFYVLGTVLRVFQQFYKVGATNILILYKREWRHSVIKKITQSYTASKLEFLWKPSHPLKQYCAVEPSSRVGMFCAVPSTGL